MIGHDNTGYVALCGKLFTSHGEGRRHEQTCPFCIAEDRRIEAETNGWDDPEQRASE